MPAQIIGAIGLTSTAAGAYYVASGTLDRTAVLLWIANWLFAADQIHFVQTRIRGQQLTSATRSSPAENGSCTRRLGWSLCSWRQACTA